jgi:RHS repeat-associated protein
MRTDILTKTLPVLGLALASMSYAQTNTENYVQSKTCLNDDCTRVSETITYFDGLGRAKQIVSVKSTPSGKDLVTPVTYDGFGRQVKDILPVPAPTQNSMIHTGIVNESAANSYYGVSNAFSEKEVENSPLDRVLQQAAPGEPWKMSSGKTRKLGYDANLGNEVKKFRAVTTPSTVNNVSTGVSTLSLSSDNSGYYPASTLYKNTVTDEDGNTVTEFTNGQGQTLLVRRNDGSQNVDTYYVYNDYKQLAYVLSPKAVQQISQANNWITDVVVNELCYQYRYDGRSRLVEKKLPGKDWEWMVYDKQDRLVLTQDGMLRTAANTFSTRGWMFTKYDNYNRTVLTGFYPSTESRTAVQEYVNNLPATSLNPLNNEDRVSNPVVIGGMNVYYRNLAYPSTGTILLGINYYDTYPPEAPAIPATVLGQYTLAQATGADNDASTNSLPTASYVRNIEDTNWTKNYTYYDTMGRVVFTHSINHLGGRTQTESKLDFAGTVQQTITRHKRLNTDTDRVITENFTYDPQNRLLTHTHQVDSNPVEFLAQNTYNEISQLTNKKVGGTAASSPLQNIDYAYNIRGWMTKINDPANLSGKLFGYELRYNNPVSSNITAGRFNGNITEIDWNNGSENLMKRYNYDYDKLNRLASAYYREPSTGVSGSFNEYLTYDLNGNINTLKRFAPQVFSPTSTLIDDLEYQYAGNRLTKVIENMPNSTGYEGGNNVIDYDLNGSMTNMKDKGISGIGYNYLNLPDAFGITQPDPWTGAPVSFGVGYLYRADGVKVRKTYSSGGGRGQSTSYKHTDYLDGFQYSFSETVQPCLWCRTSVAYEQEAFKDPAPFDPTPISLGWQLDFVPTAEGFYSFTENRYIYQYKDHLGNARVSYAKNSHGALEITDTNNYYAFGMNHIGGMKSMLGAYQNYKYNGKEIQETGMYDYGARFYMPDLGRWGVIDNKAEKYPSMSSYTYAGNNPIAFIDPDGNELILSFATATAEQSYKDLVKNTLGGKYEAVYTQITGTSNYKVTLNMINKDASLTKEQQAFYNSYNKVVEAKESVSHNVVENSTKADGGNFQTGELDIADILEFDKAGKGGTSSAGALIHEHAEQLKKEKMGIAKGSVGKIETDAAGNTIYPDFNKAHAEGFKEENKTNGNERVETTGPMSINVFKEKDGTRTSQAIWPTSTGGITVQKTNLP